MKNYKRFRLKVKKYLQCYLLFIISRLNNRIFTFVGMCRAWMMAMLSIPGSPVYIADTIFTGLFFRSEGSVCYE